MKWCVMNKQPGKPAMFWSKAGDAVNGENVGENLNAENGTVICGLCHHNCKIPENGAGFCGVRENCGGKLYALGYGLVSSIALDPVEKKPLRMFCPGKRVLSIGGYGCNLRCPFCQNFEIAQIAAGGARGQTSLGRRRNAKIVPPELIADLALNSVTDGNIGVAYTYNEPFMGYEYIYDCAKLVRGAGLLNVLVTNGCVSREPLELMLPLIDAVNIDLKSFSEAFYKKIGGCLDTVKNTIKSAAAGCHAEITTLVIPGENDSEDEIAALAGWLASVNADMPLHLTRFFPRYKYSGREPASVQTVHRLGDAAKKYLKNVFT